MDGDMSPPPLNALSATRIDDHQFAASLLKPIKGRRPAPQVHIGSLGNGRIRPEKPPSCYHCPGSPLNTSSWSPGRARVQNKRARRGRYESPVSRDTSQSHVGQRFSKWDESDL